MFTKMHINKTLSKINYSLILWAIIPILMIWVVSDYLFKPNFALTRNLYFSNKQLTYQHLQFVVNKPEIPKFNWQGEALVTFWFDDAWLSQYYIAAPILDKYRYVAAISVPTSHAAYDDYADWFKLRQLQGRGWEITSHSVSHDCDYYGYPAEKLEDEFKKSRQMLIYEGLRHDHYVSPCGVVTENIKTLAQKYYKSMRTVDADTNPLPLKDKYSIQAVAVGSETTLDEVEAWIKRAKEEKSWLILLFLQVDIKETKYGVSPKMFEKIVTLVNHYSLSVVLPTQALQVTLPVKKD